MLCLNEVSNTPLHSTLQLQLSHWGNIEGSFAYSTEENFKEESRPKWQDLADSTKKQRKKKGTYPGLILQITGQLASSVNTYYDDDSAVIGSNLNYAAIHQLGGQAGKGLKAERPARPYLQLTDDDFAEIIDKIKMYLIKKIIFNFNKISIFF